LIATGFEVQLAPAVIEKLGKEGIMARSSFITTLFLDIGYVLLTKRRYPGRRASALLHFVGTKSGQNRTDRL
jgi:hypothetical protein